MSELNIDQEIKKLRWRCRRGTLELDLMLVRYLDRCFAAADSDEQQTFLQLLELEDSDLLRYMLGEQRPDNQYLASLVELIRHLPV